MVHRIFLRPRLSHNRAATDSDRRSSSLISCVFAPEPQPIEIFAPKQRVLGDLRVVIKLRCTDHLSRKFSV
jgi:hypothetical protein